MSSILAFFQSCPKQQCQKASIYAPPSFQCLCLLPGSDLAGSFSGKGYPPFSYGQSLLFIVQTFSLKQTVLPLKKL